MNLEEYNNQTILIIKNSEPINDKHVKEKGNSARLLAETSDVDKWYECRNICLNNKNCVTYNFDDENKNCKIYRDEPYKSIRNLSLKDCTKFCSKDDQCDFLSHSFDNKCTLFTREKYDGNTIIGDLWFDFPIFGINLQKGIELDNFQKCVDNLDNKDAVFYKKDKKDKKGICINKQLYKYNPGNTSIFFNKTPVDQYKLLNPIIGLKSKNRNNIDKYKIVITFILIFIMLLFYNYIF
jgi:hypothetical protein